MTPTAALVVETVVLMKDAAVEIVQMSKPALKTVVVVAKPVMTRKSPIVAVVDVWISRQTTTTVEPVEALANQAKIAAVENVSI